MFNKLFDDKKEFIWYVISGTVVTIVSWITYYIPYQILGWSNMVSEIFSWIITVATAYVTNKIWVFKSYSWDWKVVKPEAVKFISMRLASGVAEWILMWLFVDKMGFNGMLMKILVSVIVVIMNYVCSKLLIFKKS